MSTLPPQRSSILLIYDDSSLLDALTRVLEARGFAVSIAASAFSAMTQLQGSKEFDAIITGWDASHGVGAEVYQWALKNRYHLRGQFIFLADEVPESFHELVEGRCLAVPPTEIEEIIRVTDAAARRARAVKATDLSDDELEWIDVDKPSLLLVDDEPLQLSFMARMLDSVGFAVTQCDSGNAAIARLDNEEYDVILSDWYMPDGSGAELYEWISFYRSDLEARCVFMSGAAPEDFKDKAPGRLMVPKGQDSPKLVSQLMMIVRASRAKRVG
jgi:CheY-like chemotaxis protein